MYRVIVQDGKRLQTLKVAEPERAFRLYEHTCMYLLNMWDIRRRKDTYAELYDDVTNELISYYYPEKVFECT